MTDWTTPEDVPETTVERLHQWLQAGNPADAATSAERAVASVIRAFWPAPAPTIAEALGVWVDSLGLNFGEVASLTPLIARAEQIEEALAVEGRRVEKIAAERDEAKKERDHFFREVENVRNWKEQLLNDRDEARAEVRSLQFDKLEGITAVGWMEQAKEASAEVERLTAERDRLEAAQHLADGTAWGGPVREPTTLPNPADVPVHPSDQQANSLETPNSSLPAPADVKPNEPWLIRVGEREAVGLRDDHSVWPWCVYFSNGEYADLSDSVVTLVSRLVPAPRVITDPDELDKLAATSIIRDGRGWPGGVTDQGVTMINGFCVSDEELLSHGPVTVLWEPGA